MAKPLPLNRETLPTWKARLSNINASSVRQFGSLQPADMLCHLRRTLEPVTGDFDPGADISNIITRTTLFHEFFLAIPWPKGKVKAPDWLTPTAQGDIQSEREQLFAIMDKFVAMHTANPKAKIKNPLLGEISLDYNTRLQGKHLEHHCQQYGV